MQPLVRGNKGAFEPDFLALILCKSVPCEPVAGQKGLVAPGGGGRWEAGASRAELRCFLCLGLHEPAPHRKGEQHLTDLWAGVSRRQSVAILWNTLSYDFKQKEYCLVVTCS